MAGSTMLSRHAPLVSPFRDGTNEPRWLAISQAEASHVVAVARSAGDQRRPFGDRHWSGPPAARDFAVLIRSGHEHHCQRGGVTKAQVNTMTALATSPSTANAD